MSDCDESGCQNYARPGHQYCDWHERNPREATTDQAPAQGTVPLPELWTDEHISRALRGKYLGDEPESWVIVGVRYVDFVRAMTVATALRTDYQQDRQRLAAEVANLQAAYDLRGAHLDAAQQRIERLEGAIVAGGPILRAIREEMIGNDE